MSPPIDLVWKSECYPKEMAGEVLEMLTSREKVVKVLRMCNFGRARRIRCDSILLRSGASLRLMRPTVNSPRMGVCGYSGEI